MVVAKNPKVSVVITSYNYGKYLPEAIDSVIQQTYKNLEIIIIDDGSIDNTREVVQPYLRYNFLRYIYKENGGQASAKNLGIISSNSDFIAFLDADDAWNCTKLQKQMPNFSNPRIGVVYSDSKDMDPDGNVMQHSNKRRHPYLIRRSGRVTNFLIFDNFVGFSSSVVRKECFDRVGLFDQSLKMGIDWDLWLRISLYYDFYFLDEPLLLYRKAHKGQMSKNVEERLNCADRILDNFLKANSGNLPENIINRALAYSYFNRGHYWFKKNKKRSMQFYLKALEKDKTEFFMHITRLINEKIEGAKGKAKRIWQT